jgi:ribosomal protein L32E
MDTRALFRRYLKLEKEAEKRQVSKTASSADIKSAWDKANKVYDQWRKATGKDTEIDEEY